MAEDQLKPCPFCSSGAWIVTFPPRHPYTTDEFGAACQAMGGCIAGQASQRFAMRAHAVEAWNRRAPAASAERPGREEPVALVWEVDLRPDEFTAKTPFGMYFVNNLRGRHQGFGVRFQGFGLAGKFDERDFETPEEAKAAGSRHWLSLVRSLFAHPAPVKAEPVGEAGTMPGTTGFTMAVFKASDVPIGTKLFAVPATPEGPENQQDSSSRNTGNHQCADAGPSPRSQEPAAWRYEFSVPRQEDGMLDGTMTWHVGYGAAPPSFEVRNLTPLYEGGDHA